MQKNLLVPAPWSLSGSAYIMFLHMPKSMRQQFKEYKSPISICMLVQYDSSPVGPYNEIVFIPGLRRYHRKWYGSVSHMLVSSEASVIGGRENWGFPKELAQFTWDKDKKQEHIIITQAQHALGEFHLQSYGPALPLNTRFFPQTLFKLMQPYNDKNYCVTPQAHVCANIARVHSLKINEKYFPDVASMANLFTLHLQRFHLVFPLSTIYTNQA